MVSISAPQAPPPAPPIDTRPLLDVAGVAAWLGVNPETVRRHARAGHLRTVRVGRAHRFRPADVEAYLAAGGVR